MLLAVWSLYATHAAAATYEEKDFPFQIDPFLDHYKVIIIAGVNMVAREKPECATVDTKSVTNYGGTPDDPEFVVTCTDAAGKVTQAHFSKTDVTGDPASDIPKDFSAAQ
jgi:hypothetical protein